MSVASWRKLAAACVENAGYVFLGAPAQFAGAAARQILNRPLARGEIDRDSVRSILVTRVDGLGDVVVLSTFLRGLRAGFPGAEISLVVDEKVRQFVELCPYVDRVIGIYETPSKYKRIVMGAAHAWSFARKHLHATQLDLAINPRWDIDSRSATLLGYFSLARHHVGFSESVTARKARINRGADRLYSRLIRAAPDTIHEQERGNEALAALGLPPEHGRPEVWLGEADLAWAEEAAARYGLNAERPAVCLAIGAVEAKRMWPLERFREVAQWLVDEFDARVVLMGDKRDRAASEPVFRGLPEGIVNLSGACTLRQAAAMLRHMDVFVGNDSGPMHLAAAAGVPVVEISCHPADGDPGHVNSPVRYGPIGVPARILQPETGQAPCSAGCHATVAHCILDIAAADVQGAIRELLAERKRQGVGREALATSQEA